MIDEFINLLRLLFSEDAHQRIQQNSNMELLSMPWLTRVQHSVTHLQVLHQTPAMSLNICCFYIYFLVISYPILDTDQRKNIQNISRKQTS